MDATEGTARPVFDPSVAHPARVYNVWLGGKDHYAADRDVAARVIEQRPQVLDASAANRQFLGRAVRHAARCYGVRQFIDIGTGLPAPDNTHEIAQQVDAWSRVVYVDNDPLVMSHARALLASTDEGCCDYLHADLRDTTRILKEARRTLDFSRPVAVLLLAVLHFVAFSDRFKINMCSDLLLYVVNMFATCMAAVGLMRVRTLAWMREPGYVMVCGA